MGLHWWRLWLWCSSWVTGRRCHAQLDECPHAREARTCSANLRQPTEAKEMYALANRLSNGTPVQMTDLSAQFSAGGAVLPGGRRRLLYPQPDRHRPNLPDGIAEPHPALGR